MPRTALLGTSSSPVVRVPTRGNSHHGFPPCGQEAFARVIAIKGSSIVEETVEHGEPGAHFTLEGSPFGASKNPRLSGPTLGPGSLACLFLSPHDSSGSRRVAPAFAQPSKTWSLVTCFLIHTKQTAGNLASAPRPHTSVSKEMKNPGLVPTFLHGTHPFRLFFTK